MAAVPTRREAGLFERWVSEPPRRPFETPRASDLVPQDGVEWTDVDPPRTPDTLTGG